MLTLQLKLLVKEILKDKILGMTHRDEGLRVVEYYHGILEETGEQRKGKQVVVITCRMKWACYDGMEGHGERQAKWRLGRTKMKQMRRESKKEGWSKMGTL